MPAPFMHILRLRLRQPQFYWFLGHLMSMYHFIRFHLAFFSSSSQKYHYGRFLLYVTVTYGIVLYQFYKSGQLQRKNFMLQLRQLDNLQYFCMVAVLYVCSLGGAMVNSALYSPVIFSLFHCCNYFKENLLPFMPLQPILKSTLNQRITFFIQRYNGSFLQMAQVFEIMCGVRSGLLGLPIATVSLLAGFSVQRISNLIALLAYVCFFKLRYLRSETIRLLTGQYVGRMDGYVHSNVPSMAPKWQGYKQLVSRLFWRLPA